MDGVVADFDKYWVARHGSKKEWKDENFHNDILNEGLFANLEMMPGAEELLDEVRLIKKAYGCQVYMLTSLGSTDLNVGREAATQKRDWLIKHDIEFMPIFVSYLEQKGYYADATAILIDDNSRATNAFMQGGGKAILHVNSDSTIIKLRQLIER
jgi:Uncharacterized protein conserved in bacteria